MSKKNATVFQKTISFPFYFFFIGNFPLIALWAVNKIQIKPAVVLPTLLVNAAIVIVLWLILSLVFRSFAQGSKYSLIVSLLLFSYGHVYDLIKKNETLVNQLGFLKLLLIYLIVGILLFWLLRKVKFSKSTTLLLNFLSVGILFYNLGTIFLYEIQTNTVQPVAEVQESSTTVDTNQPDVYYIILDAYSRQDVLSEIFNYDNSEFIEALRQRGFYVADCSNSNYDSTLASVATALNYSYRDTYQIPGDPLIEIPGNGNFSIANNNVRSKLATLGYKFVTARGYSAFNDVKNSDIYLDVINEPTRQYAIQRSQFAHLYAKTTLIRSLFELYTSNPSAYTFLPSWFDLGDGTENIDSAKYWYYQTQFVFDSLEKLPLDNENYFVYAHINSPHGPFVFDQDGNYRYAAAPEDIKPYYVDSIIYLNKRVLALVDQLISESSTPPIIIIQGDHGSHLFPSGYDKHKILNAYYFPDGMESTLYETITPVNTFRLVLNNYFGENLDLLPDEMYVKEVNEYQIMPSTCGN